ncbi:MFS transporter [Actinopolymorpha alba]|uniref:MFS transporter n=1 Tax=Actinopolymorpha alba TaxID=533267 RepID=UPI00038261E7|nr:MFS transporter [Actinopolymorpha alba]
MSDAVSTSRTSITKVVSASLVGTTIEWYDFFLYGSAAALVFNKLFFPDHDPAVGTMLAFATYALGFVARPIGGIVFGHFGDKVGRKRMLVVSLVLMGVATFAIGLLPTYATIGILAPVLLLLCRLVQGFAVGGEWGGAVLMVAEHGSQERRGFWTSWPQAGVPAGNLLSVLVLFILASTTSDAAFTSWGWRVPFLLSAVLVVIGLWIRLSLTESAVFQEAQAEFERRRIQRRLPAVDVVRKYPREVLSAMGARFVENVCYYIFTAFVLTYVTDTVGLDRQVALNAVLVASAVHFVVIPLYGALSDRVGRRPLYLIGAVGVGLWGFAFFPLIDTKSQALITVAITVGLVLHAAMYGPQAAFFSELFGTSVRYSGASIGYQLASVFAGSLAPIIALALLAEFGSSVPVSVYLLGSAAVTVIALVFTRETRGSGLAHDRVLGEVAGSAPVDHR